MIAYTTYHKSNSGQQGGGYSFCEKWTFCENERSIVIAVVLPVDSCIQIRDRFNIKSVTGFLHPSRQKSLII